MALFFMKNENSLCGAFRFCQNKVPNQFPIFVMKYAYGSGSLKLVPNAWWMLFNDTVLNDLERRVVIGNENLKTAIAQLASSRAALEASHSATLPTASAGLSAARNGHSIASAATTQNPSNTVGLSASAGWELDVWGRLAKASTGAQAAHQASANDLATATLSAQATLAQTYFSLRTLEALQSLLERSVQASLTSESSLLTVRNRQLAFVNQLLKNIAGRWQDVGTFRK